MKNYRVRRLLSDAESAEFSSALLELATTFQLIHRTEAKKDPASALEVLPARLRSCLVSVREVDEWPGTRLLYENRATAYLFEISRGMRSGGIDLLTLGTLEDLSVWRSNGSLLLGSCTYEKDVWLELEADEYLRLEAAVPGALVPETTREQGASFN